MLVGIQYTPTIFPTSCQLISTCAFEFGAAQLPEHLVGLDARVVTVKERVGMLGSWLIWTNGMHFARLALDAGAVLFKTTME